MLMICTSVRLIPTGPKASLLWAATYNGVHNKDAYAERTYHVKPVVGHMCDVHTRYRFGIIWCKGLQLFTREDVFTAQQAQHQIKFAMADDVCDGEENEYSFCPFGGDL